MISVLDLSGGAAGGFAAMLLAEVGAEVIKVELAELSEEGTREQANDSAESLFLHRRKQRLSLDLGTPQDRERFLALTRTADILVEDSPPSRMSELGIGWQELRHQRTGLVYVSITPFGQSGPRAHWRGSELVLQAMGGVVSSTGWNDGAPQRLPGHQAAYAAGIQAADAALAAVYGVQAGTTSGVHLDISVQEAMATYATRDVSRYVYTGQDVERFGHEFGMQGWPPIGAASDGYVMLEALRAEWEAFAFFLGLDDRFLTHEWHDLAARAGRWNEIQPDFERAVRGRTKHEWFEASADQGYTFAPIDDLSEVLMSPQLAARGFFESVQQDGRTLACPRLPFTRTSEAPNNDAASFKE